VDAEAGRGFALLASMYLCPPSPEAVASWRRIAADPLPPPLDELAEALRSIDTDSREAMEDLLWEYTRLFVGPYRLPCPPWESVYTSSQRLLMQEAYEAVEACYREAGLAVGDGRVLADHIGAELQFLAVLADRAEEGGGGAQAARELARRFLDEHLAGWVGRFAGDMEAAAASLLYRTLARVTRAFVLAQAGERPGAGRAGEGGEGGAKPRREA